MADELTIDSEQFVSSKRASEISGYEQDYIGQLSRGGQLKARRVGGLWYVSVDSLTKYKEKAEEYKPEPPVQKDVRNDPDSLLSFDGKGYISASRASKLTGYSPDYIGQMARAGTILSRQVGNRWYVERMGIINHKESKDALLGAVQAESVGINRGEKESLSYAGAGPFLDYTSDNGALMPLLNKESDADASDEDDRINSIPIHIHAGKPDVLDRRPRRSGNAILLPAIQPLRVPEKTMYSLALPAIVLTIVVVLSLGFVSLKSSSVYTSNDYRDQSGSRVLTASAASARLRATRGQAWVVKIADVLEVLLTPELVYIRNK